MSDYKIVTIGCQPDNYSCFVTFFKDYILPVSLENDFIIPWRYVKGSLVSSTDDIFEDTAKDAEEIVKEIFSYIQNIAGEKVGFVYYLSGSGFNAFTPAFDLKYYVADSSGVREIYAFDYKYVDDLEDEISEEEYDKIDYENAKHLLEELSNTINIFKEEGICVSEPCIKISEDENPVKYEEYDNLNKSNDEAIIEFVLEDNICSRFLLRNGFLDFSQINLLPTLKIPYVKTIPDNCFTDFTKLEEIQLPDSLEKIGKEAFKNCTSLEKIIIPKGVTEIGDSAFEGCINLKEVSLPKSLKISGRDIFKDCPLLNENQH